MNVFTFIDVTEKEQCEELRAYFKGLGADISEENSTNNDNFVTELQQIIDVCHVCFKDSNENDIESALNSLVSLMIMVPHDSSANLIFSLCEKLVKVQSTKLGVICLRVLNNLFEGLPDLSPLRFDVHYNLIKLAGQTDSINTVFTDLNRLKKWMVDSEISVDKKQKLYRLLHEVLAESKNELAPKVMIELLGTYTEDNASQARDDAHRCIVACLADPTSFLMDHLLALKPVRFLEGEPIHDLLTIFVSDKLTAYIQFYNSHKEFIQSIGLSHEQNTHKMRLLTFMQLAEYKKELPFEILQNDLMLPPEEVEGFVIEALRTKMIRARIDQLNKRVIVSSTMHRTFGKPQWQQLRDILTRWHHNIGQVESSMEAILNTQFDPIVPAIAT